MVPASIPDGKAIQIASYGAHLERVSGSRDDVASRALECSKETFYASHNWQPFFLQGTKTFAFEVFEQMDPLPDYVFYPVGNGSLLIGSYKGFEEMRSMRWIKKTPHLVGVQAVSHSPIYTEVTGLTVETQNKSTLAGGIAIGRPARLHSVVDAIRATEGTSIVVNDERIRTAQKWLARKGYLVEPTAAAALAGYNVWRESNRDFAGRVLIPLTGLGLKDMDSLSQLV
jgi:threonine synthase